MPDIDDADEVAAADEDGVAALVSEGVLLSLCDETIVNRRSALCKSLMLVLMARPPIRSPATHCRSNVDSAEA